MKKSDGEEIVSLLRELRNQLRILAGKIVLEKNVTILQWRCLYLIAKDSPVNMNILKKELAVTGACVTNIVDELVMKNLVLRDRGKQDRRTVIVSITEKGRICIKEMKREENRFVKALTKMMDVKETRVIKDGLSALVFSFRKLIDPDHR